MKTRVRLGLLVSLLLGGVLFNGCGQWNNSTKDRAANILSEEEFTDLLVKFALAESASGMNVLSVPQYRMDTVYAFNPLAEQKVRKTQYDSTLAFYVRHPDAYKRVYESVLTRITEMQTRKDSARAALNTKAAAN